MKKRLSQREYMRDLVRRFGPDEERVVREYAAAEERGRWKGRATHTG